jgi:hypothetical protein
MERLADCHGSTLSATWRKTEQPSTPANFVELAEITAAPQAGQVTRGARVRRRSRNRSDAMDLGRYSFLKTILQFK